MDHMNTFTNVDGHLSFVLACNWAPDKITSENEKCNCSLLIAQEVANSTYLECLIDVICTQKT